MSRYVLNSNFKDDIQQFLNLKHSIGYKYTTSQRLIEQFDLLCFSKYPNEKILTKEIAITWAKPRENESASATQNRIVVIREFAKYLNSINKSAFIIPTHYMPKKPKYKSYIYTNNELKKIFNVIDNGKYTYKYEMCNLVYPIMFRLFYCCGLRNTEVRNLKVKDVDVNNGIIAVYESKNNNNRLVPLTDNLKNMISEYAKHVHYTSCDDDYFFYFNDKKIQIPKATLDFAFVRILKATGIEKNKKINPRIHDFRHTFRCELFKEIY